MNLDIISDIVKIHITVLKSIITRSKWFLLKNLGKRGIVSNAYRDFKLYLKFTDDSIGVYNLGIYEEEETSMIKSIVKEQMNVLDIGANIGYFSLVMASLVGRNGHVFSFEPNPKMFLRLEKNLEINPDLSHIIEINKVALGKKEGKAEFFSPPSGFEGLGGLKNTERISINEVIEVDVLTLDTFIKKKISKN